MAKRLVDKKDDLTMVVVPGTSPIDTMEQYDVMGDAAFLEQHRDRMNEGWNYWRVNHEKAAADLYLAYVSVWPADVKARRERRGEPSLEMTVLPQFISQVVGSARSSKFSIHVSPKSNNDMGAERDDGTSIPNAEIVEGIIRDIENRSNAHEVYCMALQHAVEAGFGWMRVRTALMPDDPFNIEVMIEHIPDRYSVIFDPYATRSDMQDAEWACLTTLMPKKEFEQRYPDINADQLGAIGHHDHYGEQFRNWWGSSQNAVRINEYYYKEPMLRTAVRFMNKRTNEELVLYEDEHENIFDDLVSSYGFVETERKTVDTYRVKLVKCLAGRILDGPFNWPGFHIPIVPVLGRKIDLGGGYREYNSLIRYAHDPARMHALWHSDMSMRVSNSPKMPYILTVDQINGHERQWMDQTREYKPYLLYNDVEGAPPPQRQQGATMGTAELHAMGTSLDGVKHAVGMHESTLGQHGNETSGVAIEKRQNAGNNSTYEYVDNLKVAIRALGDVLCGLIPRIYTGESIKRIEMKSGESALISLNQEIVDAQTGEKRVVNSISLGRYGCSVTAGPGYNTHREEVYQFLSEWGRTNPTLLDATADVLMRTSDLPMSSLMADRMRMRVPYNMLTAEEKKKRGKPEPTPEQQAEMATAQSETKKAESLALVAESNVKKAEIDLEAKKLEKEIMLSTKMEQAKKAGERDAKTDGEGNAGDGQMTPEIVSKMIKDELAENLAKK